MSAAASGARTAEPRRSFSLLELLIVVVILGVLAAVVIPHFVLRSARVNKRACMQNKAIINEQVERWHFDKGFWPADDLSDIGADPAYVPNGIPRCPVKNTRYKLVPETHRVLFHKHTEIP